MPKMDVMVLDHDGSWYVEKGEVEDGYVETPMGIHSTTTKATFIQAPPWPLASISELRTCPTPAPYLRDLRRTLMVFRNAFLPIEAVPEEPIDQADRSMREAKALKLIKRQTALVESVDSYKREKMMEMAFTGLALGIAAAVVMGVMGLLALRYVGG